MAREGLNRTGTPRTPALRSISVVPKEQSSGSLYFEPNYFSGGQTCRIENGRLKIYPDNSGNRAILPEWMEEGVTIEYLRAGGIGKGDSSHTQYEFYTGRTN